MKSKAAAPIQHLAEREASPLVRAYFEVNQLKQLYRQGWLRRGVPPERCESVAEHAYGVALLVLFLLPAHFPHLDPLRAVRLALLHDIGEVYAGDIIPADNLAPEEKFRLEEQAVLEVLSKLTGGEEYIALWREYASGGSPEARLVKELDRLEMALQAAVYERQEKLDLEEFFLSARLGLASPELEAVLAELLALRG